MAHKKRIAAMLVAVLFGIAVLFFVFFIAAEADHNCAGENCAVCCHTALCKNLFSSFGALVSICMSVLFCVALCGGLYSCRDGLSRAFSLFSQKVLLLS